MNAGASDSIYVRLANTHGIYKEEGVDGANTYDIHITGFDPVDGQIIRTADGQVITPVYNVPRTAGVMAAIQEKRLIDVRSQDEVDAIVRVMSESRAKRKALREQIAAGGGLNTLSGVASAPQPAVDSVPKDAQGGLEAPAAQTQPVQPVGAPPPDEAAAEAEELRRLSEESQRGSTTDSKRSK